MLRVNENITYHSFSLADGLGNLGSKQEQGRSSIGVSQRTVQVIRPRRGGVKGMYLKREKERLVINRVKTLLRDAWSRKNAAMGWKSCKKDSMKKKLLFLHS